jgi:hypothetical protein
MTPEAMEAMLKKSTGMPGLLGQNLVKEGYITYWQLAVALAAQFKVEFQDLEGFTPAAEAVACLPEAVARQYTALPVSLKDGKLTVAFHDPLNALNIQKISRFSYRQVRDRSQSEPRRPA